jgi:cbb3-type cytochrome oxidase maturation protein
VTIIFILIPLGLALLGAAVLAFFWAVRNGQFDDMETPAWRILMDDDRQPPPAAGGPPDDP